MRNNLPQEDLTQYLDNGKGNIDLKNRPVVNNDDGSISTVRSMSFNRDGKEILVPTVSDDGRIMSNDEAVQQYDRTGKHLGKFSTVDEANKYAQNLHNQQDSLYSKKEENLLQYLPDNTQDQVSQLRTNVYASTPISPDAAAKQYDISKQTKIPVGIVRTQENEIKQQTELNSIDYDSLVNNFPKVASQLADPNKAGAIRDDIDSLSYFEKIIGETKQTFQSNEAGAQTTNLRLRKMYGDVTGKETLSPIEENELGLYYQDQAGNKDFQLGLFKSTPVEYLAKAPSFILGNIPNIVQTAKSAIPGAIAGFVASGGNPAGGAVGGALGAFSASSRRMTADAYDEYKNFVDETGKPIEKSVAAGAAVLTGGIGGAIELIPATVLTAPIRKLFTKEGAEALLKTSVGREYLKNIAGAMLTEGAAEGAQEYTNIVFAEAAKHFSEGKFQSFGVDKDKVDMDAVLSFLGSPQVKSRVLENTIGGAIGGAGFATGATAISQASTAYSKSQADQKDKGIISDIVNKVKESKIFKRSPELFKDSTENTLGEQDVYLPAEDVQTFFQTKSPQELEEFYKIAPEARGQIETAIETGGNVVLKGNSAAVAFANESFSGLQGFAKLSPETLNEKEAQDSFLNDAVSNVGFEEQKRQTSVDEGAVKNNIKNQILGLRLPTKDAQDIITTLTSYYDTKSQRYGSEEAQTVLDSYLKNLEVKNGVKNIRSISDLDAFINKARTNKPQKKTKPLLKFLKEKGGVRLDSNLAGELKSIGLTPKSAPGLFKKEGGIGDVDNIPLSEFQERFPNVETNVNTDYVDRQAVLDLIVRETGGEDISQEMDPDQENISRFLDDLDRVGIDINTATNQEIKESIADYEKSQLEEDINQSKLSVEELEEPQPEFKPEVKPELITEQKIEDFGEVIKGAKKDLFKIYNKSISEALPEDFKDITLSKYFPEPNYEAMIAAGVDVKNLAAVKALRDIIPAKPKNPYRLKSWIDNFKAARSLANDLISGDLDLDKFLSVSKGLGGNKFRDAVKLNVELGYPAFKAAKDWTISSGEYSVYNTIKYDPPKTFFTVAKGREFGTPYETYDEALNALREKLSVKPDPEKKVTKLDIYQNIRSGEIFIGKKVAAGKFIDLRKGFTSMKEARTFLKENEQSLLELLAKMKETQPTRKEFNEERVGKDHRVGENIVPEKFASEFGFRGVQFGNYVEQAKRVSDLNNAYDALLDLSDILSVPSRALSLNGELGIAFGARGTGGRDAASAHYEPTNVVINLTKNKGAGSLGHEWWHALDNYFGKKRGQDFLTKNTRPKKNISPTGQTTIDESIRPEILEAYKGVMEAIAASELPSRSIKLDKKKSKDYWSTLEEMSARAFETYIIAKAKEKGYSNDYLANVLDEKVSDVSNEMAKDLGLEKEPYAYPTEKEIPAINAAFDKLFTTLKTRETEKGIEFFQNEKSPLGQIQFIGQKPIISLFKSANRSTLLHELGHLFLQIEKEVSQLPDVSEHIKSDWKTVEDWLGIQGGKITLEAHEKFARGFEAYLREGRAPSIGLRNAFRRFKSWLTSIYKNVKAHDVELSKPVREVFDRMLATDEAIDELRNNPIFRADEKILAMLDEEEKAKYLALTENADEKAKEKLLAKALKEVDREKTKSFKEQKQKVRAKVEEELKKTPIFRAFETLRSEDGFKINVADIENYEGDFVKKLPKDILSEDGVAVDMAADFLGFADGGVMLNDLANAPSFKSEVNRLTNEAMSQIYSDMTTDGSMQEKAIDESQNDARAKKILYELNATNAKVKTFIDTKEAYEQKAKDIISTQQIKEATNSYVFYLNEIKAAREAGIALGAKDYPKAVEWKKKQLLNHYLYRESLKVKDEVEDLRKRSIRYNKPPAVGKVWIDEEYRQNIVSLLEDFNLAENTIGHEKTNIAELETWKKEQTEEGVLGLINFSEIASFQDKDNIQNLTVEEFQTLDNAITNLAHVGQGLRTLEIDGKKVEIDEIATEIKETIENNLKEREEVRGNLTPKQKLNAAFESFMMPLIKVKNIALKLDGEKPLGTFYNHFVKPVADGEINRNKLTEETYEKLDTIYKKHFGTKAGEISGKKVFIPAVNFSYSKQDMIAFALNWGNGTNRKRIRDGFKYSDAQVNEILSNLTKNEWEFVQDMWDLIGSYFKDISDLQKKLVGFRPRKVRAVPFVFKTTDGQNIRMKGGYYPLMYDDHLAFDTNEQDLNSVFGNANSNISFEKSYTKGRSEQRVSKRVDLSLKPAFRHLSAVISDIALKEQVWNSYKILNTSKVKQAIGTHAGKETNRQLDTWLKDIFGSGLLGQDAYSGIVNAFRAGTSISTMGAKLSTALMQPSGFTQSIVKIGYGNMLKGILKTLGNGNPMQINKVVHEAMEKSKVLKDRSKTYHQDIYDTLRKMERKNIIAKNAIAIYFWPMAKMQMLVDIPTWNGAYYKGLKDFDGDEKKAAEYADLILVQAQGSGLEQDLAAFERGSAFGQRKSSLVKIFTAFYTYFNAKLNLASESYRRTNFSKPRDVARFASDFLLLFWLETLIGQALVGKGPDEDDEENFAAYNLKLTAQTFFSQFPIAREAVSVTQGFNGTPSGLSGIEKIVKGGMAVSKELTSEDDIDISKVIEGLNDSAGILFKYPSGQIDVFIDAQQKADKGEDVSLRDYFLRPKQ